MARNKRVYDDDDGRTIADMSGVTRRNLFSIRLPESSASDRPAPEPGPDRPWESSGQISGRERWSLILGALSAALLIGLPFAIVFAVAIYIIGHGLF